MVAALALRETPDGRTKSAWGWMDGPSSTWVGPMMGITILAYAVVNGIVTVFDLTGG